jgi:dihydroceramide fatty acyl 2-hydroxylase
MFESDLLDRLSRVHPAVPPAIFVPAICALFVLGARELTTAGTLAVLLAGWLFWTLTEYWLHRLVFHFEPEKGPGARLHWIIHGVHHDHPNDPLRLVMPPSVSLPLAAAFYGLFVLTLGTPEADVFAAGFLVGYLVYDMTHFYVHHRTPKRTLGKVIRELHMRHHFQDDTRGFGVSAPFWDYVFGTPLQRGSQR